MEEKAWARKELVDKKGKNTYVEISRQTRCSHSTFKQTVACAYNLSKANRTSWKARCADHSTLVDLFRMQILLPVSYVALTTYLCTRVIPRLRIRCLGRTVGIF